MSSNNNENKILPLCPECGRLPFFQFEGYPISCITIKCECGLNDSFDIKEYLKRNKNNQQKVIKIAKFIYYLFLNSVSHVKRVFVKNVLTIIGTQKQKL